MKRFFKLNPEKTLTQQPLFWIVNGILFLFALVLMGIIYFKGIYYIDWSPKGFKLFLSEFGFPISILAIIIPVTALIATIHRSSQLSKQISLLTKQNNFANYYKHYEMFKSYYLELCRDNEILNEKEGGEIYRSLFPNSKSGDYFFDKTLLQTINKLSKDYLEILEKLNNKEEVTYLEFILISSEIVLKINQAWGAYWVIPTDFGNQILSTIPGVDENEVKSVTFGGFSAKFIDSDHEDIIFEKTLSYFKLIAMLLEFEISLKNEDLAENLYSLINKEIVMCERSQEKRIASRNIYFFTTTRKKRF